MYAKSHIGSKSKQNVSEPDRRDQNTQTRWARDFWLNTYSTKISVFFWTNQDL